jgi:hypothetical protein
MDETYPMEPYEEDGNGIADYREQSRVFMGRARGFLTVSDLHQASEKGWGAAAWMAKAVAETYGWNYERHHQFNTVLYRAEELSGDRRLHSLRQAAGELHGFYYTRKMLLNDSVVERNLDQVELMLDILQPLTEGA